MTEPFICPPEHKHATVGTCYVIHKCRCVPCRSARSKAETRRNRLKAYGRYDNGLVDAAPVREHILYLQEFGYGWKRIAELTGVGNTAISSLIYGRKGSNSDPRKGETLKRTSRAKAEAILAFHPDLASLSGGALVPARGTRRRLQALVCMGWSQSKLAARLEVEVSNFGLILKREQVTAQTHRAVSDLYDELWNSKPPHENHYDLIAYNRSISYAKARRWPSALAWDDIDNDPTPRLAERSDEVDEIAIDLAMHGEQVRLTHTERREAVVRLHRLRWSDQKIASALRIADRTVLRIRQELNLPAFDFADLEQAA